MMREILFRGKAINRDVGYHKTNYKNGDWVYGLITRLFDKRVENLPAEMTNTDGVSCIEIDYKTLGQYTGLTDKNGKKIFEGDIVRAYNDICGKEIEVKGKVVFHFGCFDIDDSETGYLPLYCFITEYIEVIGNIHDNPELLKEREKE